MKKTQIILIGLGLVTIVGLYLLPSVVVDNEGQAAGVTDESASSQSQSTDIKSTHEAELSPEQELQMNTLKSKITEESAGDDYIASLKDLAGIYQELGKPDSAAYYLSLVSEREPSLASSEATGNAYYEAFTFAMDPNKVSYTAEQTRKYLTQVLDKDPTRLDLKTKIAMTYVSASNPMQGITMLREILDEDPQNEEGLYNMGMLSMQSGQYKLAINRFEELVKYHPDNLQGQVFLGVSYFEAKQKNKAKAQFENVLQMTEDPMILESVKGYLDRL